MVMWICFREVLVLLLIELLLIPEFGMPVLNTTAILDSVNRTVQSTCELLNLIPDILGSSSIK